MTMTDVPTIAVIDYGPATKATLLPRIEWGPVIGGAIAATALASVLQGFAAAIGVSVSSTAPSWRDASFALILLSGLYLLLTALVSYAFGAYVAGRMRMRLGVGATPEAEFRDGMHGILVWALAKPCSTNASAAAAIAPPITGPHSMRGSRTAAPAGPSSRTAMVGESVTVTARSFGV